ncbi:protein of unknown function [Acidithiobacillus ferrivorans]|uniref:Uncharacterized protein n=1 Tax=Acidithiobacillus ferrivorans TaxID=160808 RepID=A0ABY1MQS6_9PROT|nr:protein of unknown function [Acidithiobacillus ferrivorans]
MSACYIPYESTRKGPPDREARAQSSLAARATSMTGAAPSGTGRRSGGFRFALTGFVAAPLEIGLVPARTLQGEAAGAELPLQSRFAAVGAVSQTGITHALLGAQMVPAVLAYILVSWHRIDSVLGCNFKDAY